MGVLGGEANRPDVLVMLLVEKLVQKRDLVERAVRDVKEEIVEQVGAQEMPEKQSTFR